MELIIFAAVLFLALIGLPLYISSREKRTKDYGHIDPKDTQAAEAARGNSEVAAGTSYGSGHHNSGGIF